MVEMNEFRVAIAANGHMNGTYPVAVVEDEPNNRVRITFSDAAMMWVPLSVWEEACLKHCR